MDGWKLGRVKTWTREPQGPTVTQARTYLDHNATTPLHPAARAAMTEAFELYGNPSSVHAEGRAARATIDRARRAVADLTGCAVEAVIFTSCGTEALNIALTPEVSLDGHGIDHLLVGAGEHPAILSGHRFGDRVERVALSADGTLDLDALGAALGRLSGKRIMLAIQAANNETGVIQPVRRAADMVHAAGGYVVCDAVQAAGKIACDLPGLGADALAISAHKFGGPKGVGALCFGPSRHHLSRGVVRGGGQERGLSAGTDNIIGIAGMGAAAAVASEGMSEKSEAHEIWRGEIERTIRSVAPQAVVFGAAVRRLPNTVCFAVPGLDAQILLINLDLQGVAVSAGSACSAGKARSSHVLEAMGVSADLATRMLRVSLGTTTTRRDIESFSEAFAASLERMKPRVAA